MSSFFIVSSQLMATYINIDFNFLIRYRKASTEMEEACIMGFSGGFEQGKLVTALPELDAIHIR